MEANQKTLEFKPTPEESAEIIKKWKEAPVNYELKVHEPETESQQIMGLITKLSSDEKFDVDKLKALMTMHNDLQDRQAVRDFNIAMGSLREELSKSPVIKNKRNGQTESNYADLDAVKKVADPLMSKYGFYDRYEDDFPADGKIGTTCELVHTGGHSKRNRVEFSPDGVGIKGSANKTAVHATASSMTYGQRLSLCRALGVRISEDDDGNAAGNNFISNEDAVTLDLELNKPNMGKAKFLEFMKVESVQFIKVSDLKKAQNAVQARKNAIKEKEAKAKK